MNKKERNTKNNWMQGIAMGVCFGVAYGIIFDNLAMGMAIGMCFGMAFVGDGKKAKIRRSTAQQSNKNGMVRR